MSKQKKALEVTKQRFALKGKIGRIQEGDSFSTFRTGTQKNGKNKGKPFRAFNLNIITSQEGKIKNEIPVTLYGMKTDEIYVYNQKTKSGGMKPYDTWEHLTEDENIFGINLGLTKKEEVKEDGTIKEVIDFKSYPKYEGIALMEQMLEEGDDVFVSGEIKYSEYLGRDGKLVKKTNLEVSRINFVGDIDFHKEDFEEVATWNGEFIFMNATDKKGEKQATILGRNITQGAPNEKWIDTNFVVNYAEDKDLAGLAQNLSKSVRLGDKLNLYGNLSCRPTAQIIPSKLGGKPKQSYGGFATLNLEILGGDNGNADYPKQEHIPKFYSMEDFVIEQDNVKEESPFAKTSGLGGKAKTQEHIVEDADPFASSGQPIDISDDDLPF